ncbi:MAG: DUF4249 family protein [Bacillota bacterium]
MKSRLVLYLFFLILTFISVSCNEDFNPVGSFSDQYVLNCIISKDDRGGAGVIAFISRTYQPINEKLEPEMSSSQLIRGAKLTLTHNYKNYEMVDYKLVPRTFNPDTTLTESESKYHFRPDTIKVKLNYYALLDSKRFVLRNGEKIYLTAKMPDGKTLNSETTLPQYPSIELNFDFSRGITPKIDQFRWGNGVTFLWENSDNDHLKGCNLRINYRKIKNDQYMNINVPLKYIKQNDKFVPLNTSVGKYSSAHFEFAAFDSVLKKLSGSDPDKKNYEIINCTFSLIEYDRELSTYFSSAHGSMDSYSVRLDENIYSNMRGGLGIFGSYVVMSKSMYFDYSYIQSFGYKTVVWR